MESPKAGIPAPSGHGVFRVVANHPVRWAIALVASIYVTTLFFLPADGMWTVDNSEKYLQVQALVSSGLRSTALNWAGRTLVPETQCNPIPPPLGVIVDGKLHAIYSVPFVLFSSLPFKVAGIRGLVFLPVVATLLMLLGVARLAGSLGLGRGMQAWAVLAAGLATPLWFYSVMVWEHGLAACLLIWAVIAAVEHARSGAIQPLVLSACLAAACIFFRDDLCMFPPLLLAALLWLRKPSWPEVLRTITIFAVTAAVAVAPLGIINHVYTGNPLGLHLGSHPSEQFEYPGGLLGYLESRPPVFHLLLSALHTRLPVALVLAFPILLLFVWLPRVSLCRQRWVAPLVAGWAAVPLLLGLWGLSQGRNPIAQLIGTNSLFYSAPFIVLGLLRPDSKDGGEKDRQGITSMLARVVLAVAVLYGLITPQVTAVRGIHWGNRFLLHSYPILAVLAVATIARLHRDARARAGVGLLIPVLAIALSASGQAYSVSLALRMERFFSRLNHSVEAMNPKAVLTDAWWVPTQLYRVFPSRPVFLVSDQTCWASLEPRLKQAGITEVLEVRWNRGLEALTPGTKRITDEGLDYFGVDLRPATPSTFKWRVR